MLIAVKKLKLIHGNHMQSQLEMMFIKQLIGTNEKSGKQYK